MEAGYRERKKGKKTGIGKIKGVLKTVIFQSRGPSLIEKETTAEDCFLDPKDPVSILENRRHSEKTSQVPNLP